MAVNVNNVERKVFKYYEGLCSSTDFPKEIAKVLALGVRTEALKDVDGNELEKALVSIDKNWDIVYPKPDDSLGLTLYDEEGNYTTEYLSIEEYQKKILNQVSKIADTVILRTTTTPKDLADIEFDDLTVDSDSNKASLTMYLEIYKPAYLANPEEYPLDCERHGITPKLITKELYSDSLQLQHSTEEDISAFLCKEEDGSLLHQNDPTSGTIKLTYTECDDYVRKICGIIGDDTFSPPLTDGASTFVTFNAAQLTKIKQDDAALYSLILNSLDSGEGIEPKTYTLLEKLTITILRLGNVYNMMFEGLKKLKTYSIKTGVNSTYKVAKSPTEKLVPEFCLNGIYTPLSTSLYHLDNQTIIFDEDITFEESSQGRLVVRYTYETNEQDVISERVTLLNNHYVLMRLFDIINDEMNGPMDNVYNASGELVQTNSHISPWSKLSWYQDFEEIIVDSIDADVSISSIHDGTILVPLETAGLNADTKMRYWINTNNDRFSIIVMGNPSLDYERDRHLVSGCYCGRIESFDNSINDTAGNFALFTSSSTEPCNTTLTTEKTIREMYEYTLSAAEVKDGTYDQDALAAFITVCPWSTECTGDEYYDIQLTDKTYFNRERWPKYMIIEKGTGKPVTPFVNATEREFYMNNGKSDLLRIKIDPEHLQYNNDNYIILLNFSDYQEKFVITSGVSRDVFGNVVDVDKVKDYGINTSDGITSIMMYHTRSKAYYQKHHMLFATTEEYMSKVMYGKSSYTGEYYADRIKVTHSNDGPRGTLSDLLVIDSASLYALDELVINKDFEKDPNEYEETFVFFPITAPFSPLSDSPNARYGLAIKKQEIEPRYEDEEILLKLAMQSLSLFTEHWKNVESDIYPRDKVDDCSVYWSIVPNSAWIGSVNTPSAYSPIQLAVVNTSEYKGDLSQPIAPETGVTLDQGDNKADNTTSYLKISGFTAETGEKIYYGIAPAPIDSFGTGAHIKAVLYDGTTENESFEYNIQGVPYGGVIGDVLPTGDVQLTDAAPDKYLMLYSVKETNTTETDSTTTKTYTISKFACVPLKDGTNDTNWLLQYPCSISAYIEGGKGAMLYDNKTVNTITTSVEYDGVFDMPLVPADGYEVSAVTVINMADASTVEVIEAFEDMIINNVTYKAVRLTNVSKNIQLKVLFTEIA